VVTALVDVLELSDLFLLHWPRRKIIKIMKAIAPKF
jgi:hypothetical protein